MNQKKKMNGLKLMQLILMIINELINKMMKFSFKLIKNKKNK